MSDALDPLETAWTELLARWGDDDKHRAFVALASALERLPDAGARYRALRDDPARGEAARKGLERVLAAAMARLTPTRREPARPRGNFMLPVTALAVLWIGTLVVARGLHRPDLLRPLVFAAELALVLVVPWRKLAAREG